ncbi:MAG: hypothetical protein ACO1OQ_15030 [Rufibacter sp.]
MEVSAGAFWAETAAGKRENEPNSTAKAGLNGNGMEWKNFAITWGRPKLLYLIEKNFYIAFNLYSLAILIR